ncbi:Lipoxygenase [Psidium guajava]|nr:Lipoxygenase [Psidium guajava]
MGKSTRTNRAKKKKAKNAKCFSCEKSFESENGLADHNATVHRRGKNPCTICGSFFRNLPDLEAHEEKFGGRCDEVDALETPK